MTKRVLCYLRQSDTDGAGERSLSLESQLAVLEREAERREWRIVAVIRDADEKGWNDQRPGLPELYQRCQAGEADLIAFWALDRLARSVRIQENIVHALSLLGVEFWSHQEPFAANPLFRQILGAVNEQRTRDIRAHVQRAMRERTSRGLFQGRTPWGYIRAGKHEKLVVDPEAATIIREMYERSAAGEGPTSIALDLIERGIDTPSGGLWSASQVTRLLGHVTHRGAIASNGTILEQQHESIVSIETWHRAQRGDPTRRSPRRKVISSWLEGLIEHACGAPMYLSQPYRSKPHAEFRCRYASRGVDSALGQPCGFQPRIVRLERAEMLAWSRVVQDLEHLPRHETVFRSARTRYREIAPSTRGLAQAAEDRRKRAELWRERALERYFAGDIDRTRYDVEFARATVEEREATAELASLPTAPDQDAIEAMWRSLVDLRDHLEMVDDAGRGPVLRALGIAVVGPSSNPSARRDWGGIRIRYRSELRGFFEQSDR